MGDLMNRMARVAMQRTLEQQTIRRMQAEIAVKAAAQKEPHWTRLDWWALVFGVLALIAALLLR